MVSIRTRLFIAFLLLASGGFYVLSDWVRNIIRPAYVQAMEEAMVDTATLLASWVEQEAGADGISTDKLRAAFDSARRKRFLARIYALTKTHINMRVYVTDHNGIVLFDSDNGRDEGKDYSRWNDVYRTLRGEYGARATRSDPSDTMTSTLHVAAPIEFAGQITGVLTVAKPTESIGHFLRKAEERISVVGILTALAVIGIGVAFSYWVTRPIEKLRRYAMAVRDGKRTAAPRLGRSEIGALGVAFEEMRVALEGKQYVEDYVQTLTHQMKSPLSAIRGAAELLEEEMPPETRQQFLDNIRIESGRLQGLIDRMLQLSALENRKELRDAEPVRLASLIDEVAAEMKPLFATKQVHLAIHATAAVTVHGERFLLVQAVSNLLQNALDFSRAGDTVAVLLETRDAQAEIAVLDDGPGVPEYALAQVFDRFYSLPRPDTGRKSSGLGLTLVNEVAELHGGHARLENRPEGGARASLLLPMAPS